ncbi:MAG: SUMF1/EgtB/PvdO family nonheme iron enzyme [Burkholderiaceae bacterium]
MQGVDIANVDSAQIRCAGKELLSLALIDSRNVNLRWIAAFEAAPGAAAASAEADSGTMAAPLWELGRVGWLQEYWIARNVQRQRGERCDATRPKLASILPIADACFDVTGPPGQPQRGAAPLPSPQTVREYLVDSLETTLELLECAADDDEALYFHRLALLNEDACAERLAELAQALGIDTGLLAPCAARVARPALLFPATRWRLGSEPGCFVPDRERWAHEVALPEFEIDAQAVNWAQYGEFVEDGGYDDRRHWSASGWAWVQAQQRRTPRFVDQLRQGVLVQRFGTLVRAPMLQPVLHVSAFEADAWCRWAGRRLPGEAEWEAAALLGATRGFRWGDVREWTAGTLRPYPGWPGAAPGQPLADPAGRVQRGASFASPRRLRNPKARDGAPPERDDAFCGFRSCAV